MRKAFNFYNSYFTVFKELSDKDKLAFITALLEKQFEGKEPNLIGQAKFAYLSQKHSIDSQVLGYETKTKEKLTPTVGGRQGGSVGASVQEKGKEKGEVELTTNEKYLKFIAWFNSVMGKKYKGNNTVEGQLNARLKEGYKPTDFSIALCAMREDKFHKENNYKYITPEFLTRSAQLEKWSNFKVEVTPNYSQYDGIL